MLIPARLFFSTAMGWVFVQGGGVALANSVQHGRTLNAGRPSFAVVDEVRPGLRPAELHLAAGEPMVIYLNRDGATINPGADDASSNLSSLAKATVQIPAYRGSDASWQDIRECVTRQFAGFNVQVTDVDPQEVSHTEVVVGGFASDLRPDLDVSGLSPFTRDCSVISNAMVYVFAEGVFEPGPTQLCEIIAQEVAHSFGLDHAFLCEDTMTYLAGCGPKSFQPIAVPCGEGEARECANTIVGYDCQRAEQNSVELLSSVLGVRDGDKAPTARIIGLGEGAVLAPGFEVEVEAADDDSVISLVELRIDGVRVDVARSAPYLLRAPLQLTNGNHLLEAVVHSGAQQALSSITIAIDVGLGSSQVIGSCTLSEQESPWWAASLLALVLFAGQRKRRREPVGDSL